MRKIVMALTAGLTLGGMAAPAVHAQDCAEYERLRVKRDEALRKKDMGQYCQALAGLMKLHPAAQPADDKLKCEAGTMPVKAWTAARPEVIRMMQDTYGQQCG